ncbi:MAG: molecular chaperone TorD family protein [Gammaproteobacteria bacterium]|nr:molecular chaperone TorD family protein [Gammaproteobacteria bacterium]
MSQPAPLDQEQLQRAQCYELLASLYCAIPDDAMRQRLQQLKGGPQPEDSLASAFWSLGDAAQRLSVEAIDDEYHALFIGLGHGEVIPFASKYIAGFMFEQPLVDLRSDLKTLGIERLASVKEPEDHVSAVFESMGLLVRREAHEFQHQFFNRHVVTWIRQFTDDVRRAKHADFYAHVANLTAQFIEFEQQYFGQSPTGGRL